MSIYSEDETWTWFVGLIPIHTHPKGDTQSFNFVTASLIRAGTCRQCEIMKAFGVSKSRLDRSVHKLCKGGPSAFFTRPKRKKRGHVLTPDRIRKVQDAFNEGAIIPEVSDQFGIFRDTLRKAVKAGRLQLDPKVEGIHKAERTVLDAEAGKGLGTACTWPIDRILTALGLQNGAPLQFQRCNGVTKCIGKWNIHEI